MSSPPTPVNQPAALSSNAQMVFNRLQKNARKLTKWRKQQQVKMWRGYDADIPEFAAAIDIYDTEAGVFAVVQEYKAPKSVDENTAAQRLHDIVDATAAFMAQAPEAIIVKARQRQRGKTQYARKGEYFETSDEVIAAEGAARLKLNLHDYVDTGIFLDHRPIRRWIHQNSRDKKVLNLFCYTATVSVQAALGGAAETLSIDMSNTYLDWARRNFLLNRLAKKQHRLMREDCLEWLAEQSKRPKYYYDLVFLDPPSFSNSKRMESVLDIQRDHVKLVKQSMSLLKPDGVLIFSNNLRSFKLDAIGLSMYAIEDITRESIDPDFERNSRIHQCFKIRRKAA